MRKYLAFARLGFLEARAEPGELLGRVLFFFMILGVFSAVWRAAAASAPGAPDPREMLWYIALTEWVVMSAPIVGALMYVMPLSSSVSARIETFTSFV